MAVLVSYIPTNSASQKIVRFFVCDTYGELPASFNVGDMATADGKLYYAASIDSVLLWVELVAKPNSYALGNIIRTNTGASIIRAYQPVSINGTGVQLAYSSLSSSNVASGIALSDITVGNSGIITTCGYVESSDWTLATGSTNLVPNSRYFLSTSPGILSLSSPSATINQVVGRAITSNTLLLSSFDYIEVS